jgi:hypothetical protein
LSQKKTCSPGTMIFLFQSFQRVLDSYTVTYKQIYSKERIIVKRIFRLWWIMLWLAEVGIDEFDRAWGRLGAKLGAGSRECTKQGQELRTSKQTRQKQVWERKVWERMVCR